MQERKTLFLALFIVFFELFIAFPLGAWAANPFNFKLTGFDAVQMLGLCLIVILLLTLVLSYLFPSGSHKHVIPAFVLLSLLIYIQQNFLVWDYGVLDGRPLNFEALKTRGYIDLSLWLAALAAIVFARDFVFRHSGKLLTFTAAVTVIAAAISMASIAGNSSTRSGSFAENEKFAFSSEQNILLFLFDAFQSDIFQGFLDNNPDFKKQLDGFTFYPNTSAVFAKTYPSIPLLLTGKIYQKQQPITEFIDQSYRNSLLTQLKTAGWNVGLYPAIKATVALDKGHASNFRDYTLWQELFSDYLNALDLSLFRAVPHAAKSAVFNAGEFLAHKHLHEVGRWMDRVGGSERAKTLHTHEGIDFSLNLKSNTTAAGTEPAFRFYHLLLPHAPFFLDKHLKPVKQSKNFFTVDFSEYRDYSYASAKLLGMYLEELKSNGLYNQSTIIISSDHGGGDYTSKKYHRETDSFKDVAENGHAKASAKSLLLIKEPDAHGEMVVSTAPVSLIDIAPSIAHYAGLPTKGFEGMPISELKEHQSRKRLFNYFQFTGWDSNYLDEFQQFIIDGHVYDDSAWKAAGTLRVKQGHNRLGKYELGDVLKFGSDRKTDADLQNAFIVGEGFEFGPSKLFALNGQIDLLIELDKPLHEEKFYALELDLDAGREQAEVTIAAAGQRLASTWLGPIKTGRKTVVFATAMLKDPSLLPLRLTRISPDAADKLLALERISLLEVPLAKMDASTLIEFSKDLQRFHPTGFREAEPSRRWSADGIAALHFTAAEDFCADRYLHLQIATFSQGVGPDSLAVLFNGQPLDKVHAYRKNGGWHYYFDCSPNRINIGGANRLEFKTGDPVAVARREGEKPQLQGAAFSRLNFVSVDAVKPNPLGQ